MPCPKKQTTIQFKQEAKTATKKPDTRQGDRHLTKRDRWTNDRPRSTNDRHDKSKPRTYNRTAERVDAARTRLERYRMMLEDCLTEEERMHVKTIIGRIEDDWFN